MMVSVYLEFWLSLIIWTDLGKTLGSAVASFDDNGSSLHMLFLYSIESSLRPGNGCTCATLVVCTCTSTQTPMGVWGLLSAEVLCEIASYPKRLRISNLGNL